jgi:hypothetical protein
MKQAAPIVIARGYCEVQSEHCNGRPEHVHHILKRSQGGSHAPDNLLYVCRPCHLVAVHGNEAEAYKRGWLRRRHPAPGDFWFGVPT